MGKLKPKWLLGALAFISLSAAGGPMGYSTIKDKEVWGGKEIKYQDAQWQIALVTSPIPRLDHLTCGGVLLNSRWVITAAHCFYKEVGENCEKKNINGLYVAYGGSNLDSNLKTSVIKQLVFPQPYDCKTKNNDIALIQIDAHINLTKKISIPPLAEAMKMKMPGKPVYAVGWGLTENLIPSLELLRTPLDIVTLDSCKTKHSVLPSNVICAGGNGVHDTCRGDSGGPLFAYDANHNAKLLGIVSFGKACGEKNAPSVNTDVSAYQDWIEKTISQCTAEDIANHIC